MQVYNSLTKQKEEFLPPGSKVRMFVCGPTVYDYIHIGNARTFVVFDVIAKYLRYRGYDLRYIQNITDIDDKIIKKAQETGQDWKEISKKFERIFLENMKSLKVNSVNEYPRATNHIPQIIKQIKTLIEKGNAYLIENDGWYFDLKTFPEYGKLSGRTVEMADDAVSRIDESAGKRNKGDFCLWKFSKSNEPSWPADFGAGRPGWHIEDTAITEKYFGPQYEIHGGGRDLIFPHHEAEIAQQESASGLKPFVRYWLHVGFLINKDRGKMSKSTGNFITVEEALRRYPPEVLRFYFLSAHYRSPLEYLDDSLEKAAAGVRNLEEITAYLEKIAEKRAFSAEVDKELAAIIESGEREILEAMDNDFNTQMAFGLLNKLVNQIYDSIIKGLGIGIESYKKFNGLVSLFAEIFGVISQTKKIPPEVYKLVQEREEARKKSEFTRADKLREQIKNLGYEIEDTAYGPLIKKQI
jgi:cysteinyl-tRNA synthetase